VKIAYDNDIPKYPDYFESTLTAPGGWGRGFWTVKEQQVYHLAKTPDHKGWELMTRGFIANAHDSSPWRKIDVSLYGEYFCSDEIDIHMMEYLL